MDKIYRLLCIYTEQLKKRNKVDFKSNMKIMSFFPDATFCDSFTHVIFTAQRYCGPMAEP